MRGGETVRVGVTGDSVRSQNGSCDRRVLETRTTGTFSERSFPSTLNESKVSLEPSLQLRSVFGRDW